MAQSTTAKGLLVLLGAFMITLGVGFMYLWGIIAIYATSFFRISSNQPNLTQETTDITFPLIFLGQAISMPLAARFIKKASIRFTCIIAGAAMALIIYMASYCTTFPMFAILFGLCGGIVIGVIYTLPIAHCLTFFPHRKSTVSSIIITASGLGTLIFAYTAYGIINPNNVSYSLSNGYFGKEVADKFPEYLRTLSALMLAFISGGGLLMFQLPQGIDVAALAKLTSPEKLSKSQHLANLMENQFAITEQQRQPSHNPFRNMNYEMTYINKGEDSGKIYGQRGDLDFWPSINEKQSERYTTINQAHHQQQQIHKQQQNKPNIHECPRVRDGPKERIFWYIFFTIALGANLGLIVSGNFKTYAKNIIDNDHDLTTMGAIGALFCGFSRFFWGTMLKKFSFKFIYSFLLIINTFLAFTIVYAAHVRQIYFAYIILTYIIYGGHLGMFPAMTSQVFGIRYGGQIYGLMFYAFTVSNFIQFALVNKVESFYGYLVVFGLSGCGSVVALLITNRISYEPYDWSKRILQNNERKRIMAR